MEILIGVLAGLTVIMLFVGGVVVGWKLREHKYADSDQRRAAILDELTAEEKKLAKDEAEAFTKMMGYNIGQVYGTTTGLEGGSN